MKPLLILLVMAVVSTPAFIAKAKGRSFMLWWLFGFACFLPALIASIAVEGVRPCPQCGSSAKASAAYCPACGLYIGQNQPEAGHTADLVHDVQLTQRRDLNKPPG